jgi:hypothetical protein
MMAPRWYTLGIVAAVLVPLSARAQSATPGASPSAPTHAATESDASTASHLTPVKPRPLVARKTTAAWQLEPARTRPSQSEFSPPATTLSGLNAAAHPARLFEQPSVPHPLGSVGQARAEHPSDLASGASARGLNERVPAHPLPPAGLVPSTIRRRVPNLVSLSGTSFSARSKGTVALDGALVRERRGDR